MYNSRSIKCKKKRNESRNTGEEETIVLFLLEKIDSVEGLILRGIEAERMVRREAAVIRVLAS